MIEAHEVNRTTVPGPQEFELEREATHPFRYASKTTEVGLRGSAQSQARQLTLFRFSLEYRKL